MNVSPLSLYILQILASQNESFHASHIADILTHCTEKLVQEGSVSNALKMLQKRNMVKPVAATVPLTVRTKFWKITEHGVQELQDYEDLVYRIQTLAKKFNTYVL